MKELKKHVRTPEQVKILQGMDLVRDRLIAFKKRMNTELVIMKGDKIVYIKPEDL